MNGYNFTEGIRRILNVARLEAVRLRHQEVSPELILLALLRVTDSGGFQLLLELTGDNSRLLEQLEAQLPPGTGHQNEGELPYTRDAKQLLVRTMAAARDVGHNYVGSSHLIVALLEHTTSPAARILTDAGVTSAGAWEALSAADANDPGPDESDDTNLPDVSAFVARTHSPTDHRPIVRQLGLTPHPEGGFYREIYRSENRVSGSSGDRAAVTTIYYLLPFGEHSSWHVVESDEIWHAYAGKNLILLDYNPTSRTLQRMNLGKGTEPLFAHCVPAGHWQAATTTKGWTLAGCTVAPGFEFSDFHFVRDLPGHNDHFTGELANYRNLL